MATLIEGYTIGDDDFQSVSGSNYYAQTFTPSVAHKITSVKLLLHRAGSPGTINIGITATDGNGHPTGADLCSGTTDGDTLTTALTGEWREVTLSSSYDLDLNTKYAIVVKALSGDGANHLRWRMDKTSPTYIRGNRERTSNSTWYTGLGQDFMFEEWGTVITGYRNRYMSWIGLGLPVPSVLPHPDGTFGTIDRSQLLWLYAGFILIYATVESLTLHADSLELTLYGDLVDLTLATDSLEATLYDDTVDLTLKDDSLSLTLYEVPK